MSVTPGLTRSLAALIAAASLVGCASTSHSPVAAPARQSLSVYAEVNDVVAAATQALAEKRLGSPSVTRVAKGTRVEGSLSMAQGFLFNTYGGTGAVEINHVFPESKQLEVTAVTRSNVAGEPVGPSDALKGYNFNDPRHGYEILLTIEQALSNRSPAQIERLRAIDEAWLANEDRKRKTASAEALEKAQKEEAELDALRVAAQRGSRFVCTGEAECRKSFSLSQIYVSTKSDMKVQLATDTIIETFNPTKAGDMGAKVIKIPGVGEGGEIVLTITCKDCDRNQTKKALQLMVDFGPYIRANLR